VSTNLLVWTGAVSCYPHDSLIQLPNIADWWLQCRGGYMPHRLRERTQQFHYRKAKRQWHPITDACINVPLWYRQHLVPACAITACDLVLERWPYREDDRLYFDLPSVRVFAGVSDSINDANGVLIGTKSGKFAHWREYFNDLYNRPDPQWRQYQHSVT